MNTLVSSWPDLYLGALNLIRDEGVRRESRGGATLDVGPTTFTCHDALWVPFPGREGSAGFARAEQLCYLGGEDSELLLRHASTYGRFRDPEGVWWGAYGPRWARPLENAVRTLAHDRYSRRAVASLWSSADGFRCAYDPDIPDVPCTLGVTFWVSSGALHGHFVMRSCDAWFGLYYDLPAFTCVQRAVAWALSLELGDTVLTCTSLHLYMNHVARATSVSTPTSYDDCVSPFTFRSASLLPVVRWNVVTRTARDVVQKLVAGGDAAG